MASLLAPGGVWVKIACTQCEKKFPYYKTWNVARKFCRVCSEARTAKSKQKFEEDKKKGLSRSPDDTESSRILRQIPDAINWSIVLGRISAESH